MLKPKKCTNVCQPQILIRILVEELGHPRMEVIGPPATAEEGAAHSPAAPRVWDAERTLNLAELPCS